MKYHPDKKSTIQRSPRKSSSVSEAYDALTKQPETEGIVRGYVVRGYVVRSFDVLGMFNIPERSHGDAENEDIVEGASKRVCKFKSVLSTRQTPS
jgi:hypothetical protein